MFAMSAIEVAMLSSQARASEPSDCWASAAPRETSKAMAAVLTATPRGARSSCCFDLPVKVDLHRFCSGQVLMLSGPLLEGHG